MSFGVEGTREVDRGPSEGGGAPLGSLLPKAIPLPQALSGSHETRRDPTPVIRRTVQALIVLGTIFLLYWRRLFENGRVVPVRADVLFGAAVMLAALAWGWSVLRGNRTKHVYDWQVKIVFLGFAVLLLSVAI